MVSDEVRGALDRRTLQTDRVHIEKLHEDGLWRLSYHITDRTEREHPNEWKSTPWPFA